MKRGFPIIRCLLFSINIAINYATSLPNDEENFIDNIGSHHFNPKSPASQIHDEVDIFQLINVSAKDQGVSLVEGPINGFPAYKFHLPYGNVALHNSSTITNAMSNENGFTVVFLFRQQRNNLGALISVNSPGRLTPWFQIASNMKTGTISVKYKTNSTGKLRQIDWDLPNMHRKSQLAAWIWMSLSVDYTTGMFRLDLDCLPSKFDSMIMGKKGKFLIDIPKDSLIYFRQEPGRKKKFLGSMQVAKVLPYVTQERLWSCMQITDHPKPEHRKPLL